MFIEWGLGMQKHLEFEEPISVYLRSNAVRKPFRYQIAEMPARELFYDGLGPQAHHALRAVDAALLRRDT